MNRTWPAVLVGCVVLGVSTVCATSGGSPLPPLHGSQDPVSQETREQTKRQRDKFAVAAGGWGMKVSTQDARDSLDVNLSLDTDPDGKGIAGAESAVCRVSFHFSKATVPVIPETGKGDRYQVRLSPSGGWERGVVEHYARNEGDIGSYMTSPQRNDAVKRTFAHCSMDATWGEVSISLRVSKLGSGNHAGKALNQMSADVVAEAPGVAAQARASAEALLARAMAAIEGREEEAPPRPPAFDPEQVEAFFTPICLQMASAVRYSGDTVGLDLDPYFIGRKLSEQPPFLRYECAQMGEALWEQAHGMIRAHIAKQLVLNESQKRRCKALGHYADWLRRMANPNEERLDLLLTAKPAYSLDPDGPAENVATPPQLVGDDPFSLVDIPFWGPITDDYTRPVLELLCNVSDAFYTRGFATTIYLACTSDTAGPVAWSVIPWIPKVGPILVSAAAVFMEAGSWANYGRYAWGSIGREEYERNALSWPEHLGNLVSIAVGGYSVYQNMRPQSVRASPAAGVDDGIVPAEVQRMYNGKSYEIGAREARTLPNGRKVEIAEARYAVVGPHEGATGNVTHHTRKVAIVKDADGAERFYDYSHGSLGDPMFFLGEKGYHVWSHLTEIKSGHKTPFTSLPDALADFPALRGEYRNLISVMRNPDHSLDFAVGRYCELANQLLDYPVGMSNRIVGYYAYLKPGEKLGNAPFGKPEANTFIRLERKTRDGTHSRPVSIRVAIDPGTGKLKNVFVHDPKGANDYWMSDNVRRSLQKTMLGWIENPPGHFTGLSQVLAQRKYYNWAERTSGDGSR